MAQILKPAQDIDVNDWLPSSGSLLYPMLDEDSPVDADYVYTESDSLFEVAVEAATDPGSMVDHFVRYRARGDGNTDLRVSLVDYSVSPDEVIASWTESLVPVSFTDYEHELTSGQAGNITDYGSLMLRFEAADFTAPTLSSPQNGTETSDGTTGPGVSTNEANGTLYWAVLTNGGSCTDAQLKAGTGGNIVAGKAGNQAVSSTGAQVTSDITGLSASTDYELVWLHRDAAGNDSAQATVGLTTTASGVTTFTIKSSGGDYSTVAAWEAATDNDMTGAGEVVGEIYDVNTTAALTIAGATNTDATNFRHLTVNSANRHAGVWTTGKQNFQVSSTDGAIIVEENFFHLSYLQIRNTHATAGGSAIRVDATDIVIDACILRGTAGSINQGLEWGTGSTITARNTLAYGCSNGFYGSATTGSVLENCTAVANRTKGIAAANASALTLRNCYAGGNVSDDYSEGGASGWSTWSATTCMCEDGHTETGLTNSIAYSTANFVNVTAGSEDLHLVTGSALRNAGTDLSGTFTNDIDGETRSAWDIGADEFS